MSQRKNWTEKEDCILKKLRNQLKIISWSKISEIMSNQYNIEQRTGKQCRERYQNHLRQGIDKSPWSHQEEALLIKLHLQYGNKWVDISNQIRQYGNFRTGNNTKNYFMSIIKKSIRNYNRLLSTFRKSGLRPVQMNFISRMLNIFMQQLYDQQKKETSKVELCRKVQSSLLYFRRAEKQKIAEEELQEKIYEASNFIKQFKNCTNKRKKRFRFQSEVPVYQENLKAKQSSNSQRKQVKQIKEQNLEFFAKNGPIFKEQISQSQQSQQYSYYQQLAEFDSQNFVKKNKNDKNLTHKFYEDQQAVLRSQESLRHNFLDISELFGTANHIENEF